MVKSECYVSVNISFPLDRRRPSTALICKSGCTWLTDAHVVCNLNRHTMCLPDKLSRITLVFENRQTARNFLHRIWKKRDFSEAVLFVRNPFCDPVEIAGRLGSRSEAISDGECGSMEAVAANSVRRQTIKRGKTGEKGQRVSGTAGHTTSQGKKPPGQESGVIFSIFPDKCIPPTTAQAAFELLKQDVANSMKKLNIQDVPIPDPSVVNEDQNAKQSMVYRFPSKNLAKKVCKLYIYNDAIDAVLEQKEPEKPAEPDTDRRLLALFQKSDTAESAHVELTKTVSEQIRKLEEKLSLTMTEEKELLALHDKTNELSAQLDEFRSFFREFAEKFPQAKDDATISKLQREFGIERERLSARLPIYAARRQIIETIMSNRVSVLTADTGSGKSTQLPQYISSALETGLIVCTQPRKVAAMTLATRVAEEMLTTPPGRVVGYRVGGVSRCGAATRVLYTTDSSLLNEGLCDPLFSRYAVVVVDEAHERNLNTDLLLGEFLLLKLKFLYLLV